MAKSKEQKRREALERLTSNIAKHTGKGNPASFDQRVELSSLRRSLNYPGGSPKPRPSNTVTDPIFEKIFGPGDPVTGRVWRDPLPKDFCPTPELDHLVRRLVGMTHSDKILFVEALVSLDAPDGYFYPTYSGGGHYMDQWIQRHTDFEMFRSGPYTGLKSKIVFCRKGLIASYDNHENKLGGVSQEEYDRKRHLYLELECQRIEHDHVEA